MGKRFTINMCLKVTPEDHAALEEASRRQDVSMSQVLRMLVRAYLVPQLRTGALFPGGPNVQPVQPELFGVTLDDGK